MKLSAFFLLFSLALTHAKEDETLDQEDDGDVTDGHQGEPLKELYVETIEAADSCERKAENGDFLEVRYTGRYDDADGEVFDSSEGKENYGFQLGAGQVNILSVGISVKVF